VTDSLYAAKPWLALLNEAQKAPSALRLPGARLPRGRGEHPDRTALAYFDGRLSYREVDELSDSVAGYLAARGLERGDRVAILLQNSPHFVLALLGAWKAGAIVVPVNPMYKSGEVTHVLRDGEVTALICTDRAWESYLRETAAAVEKSGSPVRIVLTACELDFQTRNDARVLTFERLPQAADAEDLVAVARQGHPAPEGVNFGPSDIALISYTSGTSGAPKGATNTHANIMYNAERQRTGLCGCRTRRSTSRWRRCSTSPGWSANSARASTARGSLVLVYRFESGSSSTRSPSTGRTTRSAPPPPSWRWPRTRRSHPTTSRPS
jgi:long-chain acyl-CoA synthetase